MNERKRLWLCVYGGVFWFVLKRDRKVYKKTMKWIKKKRFWWDIHKSLHFLWLSVRFGKKTKSITTLFVIECEVRIENKKLSWYLKICHSFSFKKVMKEMGEFDITSVWVCDYEKRNGWSWCNKYMWLWWWRWCWWWNSGDGGDEGWRWKKSGEVKEGVVWVIVVEC